MLILMVVKLTLAILIFVKLDDIVNQIPDTLNEAFTRDRQSFQEIQRTVSYSISHHVFLFIFVYPIQLNYNRDTSLVFEPVTF